MPDEYKDKISEDDKKNIESAVEEAKKHKDADDKDELEAALKALNDAIMPIGAKMYEEASKESAAKSAESDASDESKKEEGPVEGEVVDDGKK